MRKNEQSQLRDIFSAVLQEDLVRMCLFRLTLCIITHPLKKQVLSEDFFDRCKAELITATQESVDHYQTLGGLDQALSKKAKQYFSDLLEVWCDEKKGAYHNILTDLNESLKTCEDPKSVNAFVFYLSYCIARFDYETKTIQLKQLSHAASTGQYTKSLFEAMSSHKNKEYHKLANTLESLYERRNDVLKKEARAFHLSYRPVMQPLMDTLLFNALIVVLDSLSITAFLLITYKILHYFPILVFTLLNPRKSFYPLFFNEEITPFVHESGRSMLRRGLKSLKSIIESERIALRSLSKPESQSPPHLNAPMISPTTPKTSELKPPIHSKTTDVHPPANLRKFYPREKEKNTELPQETEPYRGTSDVIPIPNEKKLSLLKENFPSEYLVQQLKNNNGHFLNAFIVLPTCHKLQKNLTPQIWQLFVSVIMDGTVTSCHRDKSSRKGSFINIRGNGGWIKVGHATQDGRLFGIRVSETTETGTVFMLTGYKTGRLAHQ